MARDQIPQLLDLRPGGFMKFHSSDVMRARQSGSNLSRALVKTRSLSLPLLSLPLLSGLALCVLCAVTALAQQTEKSETLKSDTLKIDTTLVRDRKSVV